MSFTLRTVQQKSNLPPANEVPEGVVFAVLEEPPSSPGTANNEISLWTSTAGVWTPCVLGPGTVRATSYPGIIGDGLTLKIEGGSAAPNGGQGGGVDIDGGQPIGGTTLGKVRVGHTLAGGVELGRPTSGNSNFYAPTKVKGRFAFAAQMNPQSVANGGQIRLTPSGAANPTNGWQMLIGQGGPVVTLSASQPIESLLSSADDGTVVWFWNVGPNQIVIPYDFNSCAFIGSANITLNQFDLVSFMALFGGVWMQLGAPVNVY